jgi:hypothetical protein
MVALTTHYKERSNAGFIQKINLEGYFVAERRAGDVTTMRSPG